MNTGVPCKVPGSSSSSAAPCCFGSDTCLPDLMCHDSGPPGLGSGFYMAGCTDSSFEDVACSSQCCKLLCSVRVLDSTDM